MILADPDVVELFLSGVVVLAVLSSGCKYFKRAFWERLVGVVTLIDRRCRYVLEQQ